MKTTNRGLGVGRHQLFALIDVNGFVLKNMKKAVVEEKFGLLE